MQAYSAIKAQDGGRERGRFWGGKGGWVWEGGCPYKTQSVLPIREGHTEETHAGWRAI